MIDAGPLLPDPGRLPDVEALVAGATGPQCSTLRRTNGWSCGTEAAAATAIIMQRAAGMPAPPVPFVVDRPFLFVIHEPSSDTPLFVGRILDPR